MVPMGLKITDKRQFYGSSLCPSFSLEVVGLSGECARLIDEGGWMRYVWS